MGDELIVQPTKVRHTSFHDATAHRRDVMATVWNQYATVPRDGDVSEADRSWDVLLRPLQITGELVSDHLEAHQGTERRANALPSFEPSVPEVTRWIKSVLWRHGLLPRAHPSRPGRPSVWDRGTQEVAQRTVPWTVRTSPRDRVRFRPQRRALPVDRREGPCGRTVSQGLSDCAASDRQRLIGAGGARRARRSVDPTAGCLLRRCTLHLRPVHDSRRRRRFGRGPAGCSAQEAGSTSSSTASLLTLAWRCGSTVWSPCSAGWQTAVISPVIP